VRAQLRAHGPSSSVMSMQRRYLFSFISGGLFTFLLFSALVLGLAQYAPAHLPPPPISNHIDFDDELVFVRNNVDIEPQVVAIGSSSGARSLYGAPFQGKQVKPPRKFLNVSVAGGQLDQLRYMTNFFLDQYRDVKTVITFIVPVDFKQCTGGRFFDAVDARRYAFERKPALLSYMKYFDIGYFFTTFLTIAGDRANWSTETNARLYQDWFGSRPSQVPHEWALGRLKIYSAPDNLDARCFAELKALNHDIQRRGIHHYIVIGPVWPLWMRETPGADEYIQEFRDRLDRELTGEPVVVVDGEKIAKLDDYDFTDAFHLQWHAARKFSAELARALEAPAVHSLRVHATSLVSGGG
jgi:hypothetical protein